MSSLVSTVTNTLAVNPTARVRGLEAFTSGHLWTPYGARGVFGGQVVAQSLMAAINTVEGKDLHSQHCYFLLPANSKVPITFTVERLRDGASYATRLVHALQDSRTVFILMASFSAPPRKLPADLASPSGPGVWDPDSEQPAVDHSYDDKKDEPGITETLKFDKFAAKFDPPTNGTSIKPEVQTQRRRPFQPAFQKSMPTDVVPFKDATTEEEIWERFLQRASTKGVPLGSKVRAVQNYIKERQQSPVTISIARPQSEEHPTSRAIWMRARLQPDEKLTPNMVRALIAFATDFQFIGTGARAVGLSGTSKPRLGMMASLDHCLHFYPLPADFDPSAPLLHVMDSVQVDVASGRGFVRGCVYTENGHLVASTSQEGVIRADISGKKPTLEHTRNKDQAKL
ncbi:Thioesterase/thiol ester dehydrase-isomerase [Cutaneotrichosporon oleaginosum]|uniref:Thioesterase/thiol ester dehydrase-isomerase n=1 Tax=Cutaneotrichosporon oleaginosum TaxID=879819 RepID=A0A0J0XYN7_9TREE|nr:Thioesterase/thiol ester dehydrase-isomerase [Cutaneotrichosporon oleaginosum]KLT46172.1 Thioesterase/thiol ester dehydrase-isomerase [Cutaneotrichosporon oleaginosum]TXT10181.1 hypothetical protein COLE_04115 [Cutaneotrichosporon oleaginosum]